MPLTKYMRVQYNFLLATFFSGSAELITKLNKSQLILNAHNVNN